MNQAMQQELDTRNHERSELERFAQDNGLTGKQWNKRKQRGKMARKSRKANRKGA